MSVTPYGPHSLLLRFAERADEAAFQLSRALVAELERRPPPGLREIIPAFTTLLLHFEPGIKPPTDWWREAPAERVRFPGAAATGSAGASRHQERILELSVHYAGPDLIRVAEHAKLSVEEVIARHTGPAYRVHCLGFAPGFPYLGGLDPRLHMPRLATPRPRVPAGSVAIGGEHTGIYSIPSSGGWNLIGTTDVTLFNPRAASARILACRAASDVTT